MSAPGADAVTAAPASAEETPVEVAQAGGATSAPPVPNLKHFDESSGKTIVLPSDDVKARLLERQRKQKERAEAARAEVAAKIAEREKAEREGVREGAITKPTEMSPAENKLKLVCFEKLSCDWSILPVCCAISKRFLWYSRASSYRLIGCRALPMLQYAMPSPLLSPVCCTISNFFFWYSIASSYRLRFL